MKIELRIVNRKTGRLVEKLLDNVSLKSVMLLRLLKKKRDRGWGVITEDTTSCQRTLKLKNH